MLTCPLCASPPLANLKKLLKHIRFLHADHEPFSIQCNLQGCKRTFRRLKTYENHIYTYHDLTTLEAIKSQNSTEGTESYSDPGTDDHDFDHDPGHDVNSDGIRDWREQGWPC